MRSTTSVDMMDSKLLRLILRLGLPAILGLSANAVNQFIDALWITRLSPLAMAAIGLTFPVLLVVGAVTAGVGVATAAEIGRRIGRGDQDGAQNIVVSAGVLAAGVSTVLAALVAAYYQPILNAVGASSDTLPLAWGYLNVLLWFAPFAALQVVFDFTALGAGHSWRSMQSLLLCFGLNIVLDPIFIFGFGWGVGGAALATICGQLAALTLYVVWFRKGTLGVRPQRGRVGRAEVVALLRFAPPVSLLNLLTAAAFLFVLRQASRISDDLFVAALSFDLRLVSLVIIPAQGLALGAQAAVSHAHGASLHQRAHVLVRFILILSFGFGAISMIALLGLQSFLIPMMVPQAEMEAAAAGLLPYFAGYVIGSCIYIPLLTGFQARDRAIPAALVALAPTGYVMLPLAYVLPAIWGFSGLLWVFPLSGLITAGLAIALHLMNGSQAGAQSTAVPADTA
jgi:putative MATE family efflux protein